MAELPLPTRYILFRIRVQVNEPPADRLNRLRRVTPFASSTPLFSELTDRNLRAIPLYLTFTYGRHNSVPRRDPKHGEVMQFDIDSGDITVGSGNRFDD